MPGGPSFEQVVMPHLDAAHNLAGWLVRIPRDAEDVVQEACLRAVRFFGGYQEGNARAWLLRIVRNTAYTFPEKKRPGDLTDSDFFRPFQTGITLFAKFSAALGDVARCVPRPEMPKCFRAAGPLRWVMRKRRKTGATGRFAFIVGSCCQRGNKAWLTR